MANPATNHFPTEGRLAAVDYGTVRIGVAVCDPSWMLASPLDVIQVANPDKDADAFRQLIKQERIVGFVVGLPIHCDGGESQKSTESRTFARWLADETNLPVRLFDERFTTSAAKQRLNQGNLSRHKKKKRLDAIAALVLLESFLEATHYDGTVAGEPIDQPIKDGDPLDDA